MEITNDYLGSGRYAMVSGHRVYAGCLDWDEETGCWQRPTAIAVSGYDRHWAFPTTSDEDSLATDGCELDGYAVNGTEIRGMIARGDDKFVFLDNEFFLLRGEDPISGWRFERLDGVGCVSARTLADCRSTFIWHDGRQFYAFSGGLAKPISRFAVDSSIIDWSKPHNAVYHGDRYIFYCTGTDGVHRLMSYDLVSGAWRVRESPSLELSGICTNGAGGPVYGVTAGGEAVDIMGSTAGDGQAAAVRDVWTKYLVIADPQTDVLVRAAVFEIETEAPDGVNIDLTFNTQGLRNGTLTKTLHVTPERTRQRVGLNLQCNAIQVRISYTGENPPTIYSIGLITDEAAMR
jgi:hypothetical protein